MKAVYPTFIAQDGEDYLVYVPDWDIYTQADSFFNAIEMARDAIGLKGIDFEDDGKEFPQASDSSEAEKKAKEDIEIIDFSTSVLTFVDIDFAEYRKKNDNRMVKKNCTIPLYLNVAAEKEGINFSRVLQEALIKKLDT